MTGNEKKCLKKNNTSWACTYHMIANNMTTRRAVSKPAIASIRMMGPNNRPPSSVGSGVVEGVLVGRDTPFPEPVPSGWCGWGERGGIKGGRGGEGRWEGGREGGSES